MSLLQHCSTATNQKKHIYIKVFRFILFDEKKTVAHEVFAE